MHCFYESRFHAIYLFLYSQRVLKRNRCQANNFQEFLAVQKVHILPVSNNVCLNLKRTLGHLKRD
jgi:hypothetical protein